MAERENANSHFSAQKVFNWASLAVAVLALIVPTFLSLRAEQSKEITLEHVRTQNLLNSEAAKSPSLKIFRDGVEVIRPWLFSLRIENTGSIPIQKGDIERPLTLKFQKSKVVHSEVSARSPENLEVSLAKSPESDLVITHALLNPRDSLFVDIILDGEQEFPLVLSRISGIKAVTLNRDSGADKGPAPLLGTLPKPVRAMIIIVSFGLFAIMALGSLMLFADAFKRVIRNPRPADLARPSKLGDRLSFQIWRSVGDLPNADEFVQNTLSTLITSLDPDALLDVQGMRAKLLDEIAQRGINYPEDQLTHVVVNLENRVREVIHRSIARHYRIHAPPKLDEALADELSKSPIGTRSLSEYLRDCDAVFDRLVERYVAEERDVPFAKKLSWTDLWGGLAASAVTASLGLVLFSTYRLFIPQ